MKSLVAPLQTYTLYVVPVHSLVVEPDWLSWLSCSWLVSGCSWLASPTFCWSRLTCGVRDRCRRRPSVASSPSRRAWNLHTFSCSACEANTHKRVILHSSGWCQTFPLNHLESTPGKFYIQTSTSDVNCVMLECNILSLQFTREWKKKGDQIGKKKTKTKKHPRRDIIYTVQEV